MFLRFARQAIEAFLVHHACILESNDVYTPYAARQQAREAVKAGNLKQIETLLLYFPSLKRTLLDDGMPLLHSACRWGTWPTIEVCVLLSRTACLIGACSVL